MAHEVFGYTDPWQLAENLWEIRGAWANALGRRMTVARLSDGRVVVHNAFELQERELNWLSSLGKVSFIIAPNIFHCSDAGWMAQRFLEAELYVPASKLKGFRGKGLNPKDVNREFPVLEEFQCYPMAGTRMEEAAFFHRPSRTLILCDLAFNMTDVFSGLERVFMAWNKVGGRFGPSRLTKLLFANDKRALLASYRRLFELDFDRVIVNHGEVVESGGKAKLMAGVEEIFGS